MEIYEVLKCSRRYGKDARYAKKNQINRLTPRFPSYSSHALYTSRPLPVLLDRNIGLEVRLWNPALSADDKPFDAVNNVDSDVLPLQLHTLLFAELIVQGSHRS